jgi:hypothetical protein
MSTPPVPRQVTAQRPLGRAVAGHRRVRLGLLQLAYIAVAAVLGALLPRIQVGSAPADKMSQLLFATAAGVLPLLGILSSLLFLVVQWGHSMFTPRLNLFRDHPVVWHAFGFFTAIFVFPWTATLLVLIAVSLIRIVMTTRSSPAATFSWTVASSPPTSSASSPHSDRSSRQSSLPCLHLDQ